MNTERNLGLAVVRGALWLLVGIATAVIMARYARGLGATTALTDATPWGLWIGFDVLSGVALAAGGFVVAAAVYIFRLERYHGMVRPAVLTAFLGYVAVALGLMVDLGRPWNIWRPILYWQTDSPLFEVAWCVMLYLTVLALEFAPVVLEGVGWRKTLRFMQIFTLPLVITGIALSTLHQSSLGTLFLLARDRLHPLWDSPIQPLLFFISAIGLGLSMVVAEGMASSWVFRRGPEWPQLRGLARAATWVLGLWLLVRVFDLAVRGSLVRVLDGGWFAGLFVVELGLVAVVPILLIRLPRFRESRSAIGLAAASAVVGVVLNRIDVGGLAQVVPGASSMKLYVPALTELAVSVGLVAGMSLIFLACVERFPVWERPVGRMDHFTPPAVAPTSRLRVGGDWFGDASVAGLSWVVGAVLGVMLLELTTLGGDSPRSTPIRGPRSVMAVRTVVDGRWPAHLQMVDDRHDTSVVERAANSPHEAGVTDALIIDGDRDGRSVVFDHAGHQRRLGGELSCGRCHHRNLPSDRGTSCAVCHRDMYACSSTFGHQVHVSALGGNDSCARCHHEGAAQLSVATTTDCIQCHGVEKRPSEPDDGLPGVADHASDVGRCTSCHAVGSRPHFTHAPDPSSVRGVAPGYREAMHRLCIGCHSVVESRRPAGSEPVLSRCRGCHPEGEGDHDATGAVPSGRLTASIAAVRGGAS